MLCERCQGTRFVPYMGTDPRFVNRGMVERCPDCLGFGVTYCCDEAGANPPNTNADVARDSARKPFPRVSSAGLRGAKALAKKQLKRD